MKRFIFTKAWSLVKSKGLTISEALKVVWAFVKGQAGLIEKVAKIVLNDTRYTLKSLAPVEFESFDFASFKNGKATRQYFVNIFKESLSNIEELHRVAKIVKANKKAKLFIPLNF